MTTATDPKLAAALDVIARTGAKSTQLRYQDDEEPTVWLATALYDNVWDVAAGRTPTEAVLRLCEQLVDGGQCTHCHKPTAFDTSFNNAFLDQHICWWQWDPELTKFRRSCE